MNGILLVDKPAGWTSFDVVAKVRSTLRAESKEQRTKVKVGHTGTLDPLATGLLVLLIGDYTKRAGEYTKLDKTYEVTMKLGVTSSTGDEEGVKTTVSGKNQSESAIRTVLGHFEGEIQQTPPKYSAVKINGQRAYKLARAGKEVKLEPRKVIVYKITDIKIPPIVQKTTIVENSTIKNAEELPEVRFTAKVSSGTYIRSLVEDIGKELGTGAYMSALLRTEVGKFKIQDAIVPDDTSMLQHILLK